MSAAVPSFFIIAVPANEECANAREVGCGTVLSDSTLLATHREDYGCGVPHVGPRTGPLSLAPFAAARPSPWQTVERVGCVFFEIRL